MFDPLSPACASGSSSASGRSSAARRIGPRCRSRFRRPARSWGRRLTAKPLEPPSRKELTPDAVSQRALRFLIETGEVVEINAELVMSAQRCGAGHRR